MDFTPRRPYVLLLATVGTLLAALWSSPSLAQVVWPDRSLYMVVPFPPGSSPDIVARTLAEPLSAALGQKVIIENKPGAGGNIGTRLVAQA